MPKRGTVREDGLVYHRKKKGKEVWLTPEAYQVALDKENKYRSHCRKVYESLNKPKPAFGEYCPRRNLYFICISSSGKEVWRNRNWFEKFRSKQRINKRKYYDKCKQLPKNGLKIGDPHPNDPNLFVIYKLGNKAVYGDSKKLKDRKECQRRYYLKRDFKYKKMREKSLEGRERIRRGTVNSENNLIFWHYDDVGKEKWITKENFEIKMNKERIKRKNYRERKKQERILKNANSPQETNLG